MDVTRRIALLGSTGSIGRQTLDVVARLADEFEIVTLAAGNNHQILLEQIGQFKPKFVSCECEIDTDMFPMVEFSSGIDGLIAAATHPDVDIVVVATSGHAAILPTLRAIQEGKIIALANKEVIVCAGGVIVPEARRRGVEIRPVDSEHSAVWQCLHSPRVSEDVTTVTLTASGGPFLDFPIETLGGVTVEQALRHPNWSMGSKITIDSATLMNKGLEVIEAHWLFEVPYEQIDVVIHPQSIVHSLVSFADGSVLAQMGVHDMRVPIQHALTYPRRVPAPQHKLDIAQIGRLEFRAPDLVRFPALRLAREAGLAGSTYPTVLSGADEVAVEAFLAGEIAFTRIADVVEEALDRHVAPSGDLDLESVSVADRWTRDIARQIIATLTR